MAWVVDHCLLIDLAVDDPKFFAASARLLDCQITAVECPGVWRPDCSGEEFLERLNIAWPETWTLADPSRLHRMHRYVAGNEKATFPNARLPMF